MNEVERVREADALARTALAFLEELLPAAHMQITYERADDECQVSDPLHTYRSRWQVPECPGYYRVVRFSLDEWVSTFLGTGAEKHLQEAYRGLHIPVEIAQHWAQQVHMHRHPEPQKALQSNLPLHIIAHEIADRFAVLTGEEQYGFEYYLQPGAHNDLAETIVSTVDYMCNLAGDQVEHQRLSHGVLIAASESEGSILPWGRYPSDFAVLKRTPLLSDGDRALLWIAPDGSPVRLITRCRFERRFGYPRRDFGTLSFAAAVSKSQRGIVIILRPAGAIVIFVGGKPLFIRRSGSWTGLLWDTIREVMVERWGEVGARIFDASLILATSGCGGIVGIAGRTPGQLHRKDRVDVARASFHDPAQPVAAEWLFHQLLPSGRITDMSVDTLAMLAAIDGATVVDPSGQLLAYGAIVPSWHGGSEGARASAARALSSQGFVINVSADGPIQLFESQRELLRM